MFMTFTLPALYCEPVLSLKNKQQTGFGNIWDPHLLAVHTHAQGKYKITEIYSIHTVVMHKYQQFCKETEMITSLQLVMWCQPHKYYPLR